MEFSSGFEDNADEIIRLFAVTFTASEGSDEGKLIGILVKNLLETTQDDDLFVFSALNDDVLAGCIIFSRLTFTQDDRAVFILSPVAVETSQQSKGIGKALLAYGLNTLRERSIDVAVTYGDPNYYRKVGFLPITEVVANAPLPLQQPEGWLAQSLTDRPLDPLRGASRCVDALNDPAYW